MRCLKGLDSIKAHNKFLTTSASQLADADWGLALGNCRISSSTRCVFFLFGILAGALNYAYGDGASFDLIGPKVEVRVQREGKTLPISEVPNLQPGDRLWVHPDLPDTQSVHYLMIVAFLRGATNPPPETWFTRVDAWSKPVHEEGIFVNVPSEAEEALIFLAPETGGAFNSLRNAVRGKPGAFVRAAQDLNQASLDRLRLEKYLETIREFPTGDSEKLKAQTTVLARSLNIRLDQQCFDKPSAQQVPCLTQNQDQLVLDDAHSQSMVATLTSGSSSDLISQMSATPMAKGGMYSPYIGAVVDVVRILSTAHTAQYQYIPALALPKQDQLNLRLNNPPSFRNPKSVIVIGLPPVRQAIDPPLRAIDTTQVFCIDKASLVLPAAGAPLVFATELSHNLVLHIEAKSAHGLDLPARPDPVLGGFVIETSALPGTEADGEISGVVKGEWGFRTFDGPRYRLRFARPSKWTVASKDASALIVGREDALHIESPEACCVSAVALRDEKGKITEADWKLGKGDELEVKVPLQNAAPGTLTMLVRKFRLSAPDEIPLHSYAEAGRLDAFSIHAGDKDGVLKGTRLDQVTGAEVEGVHFVPAGLTRANQVDELKLVTTEESVAAKLMSGAPLDLRIALKDGRILELSSTVDAPRPRLALLSKSIQLDQATGPSIVKLGNQDELTQEGRLNFVLKTQEPESFPPAEKVEVATADESFRVMLTVKDGNLTMQDAKTVVAVLDPIKLLGPSAFGPLQFRPVSADGVEGDWEPLVSLVRIPELKAVRCTSETDEHCTLSGDKLFLLDAVSTDPDFSNAVTVPDGYIEATLNIPLPKGGTLYLKLRDDPVTIDTATVPVQMAR